MSNFSTPVNTSKLTKSLSNSVVNTQSALNSITASIPKKPVNLINVSRTASNTNNRVTANSSGVYHSVYTFFNSTPTPTTRLVANDKYLNIFNDVVTYEVKYLLDRVGTTLPWNEIILNNLNLDKIAMSLKMDLLESFNNIHSIGNQGININAFLEMIKKALMTGRLDEIDHNYFLELSQKQAGDPIIAFSKSGDDQECIQAALGLIAYGASSADFREYYDKFTRNQIKRQRRLNTDINARLNIIQFDGDQESLLLKDYGVDITNADSSVTSMNIGDGAGYYVSTIDAKGSEYPLATENDLSAAYYVPPDLRYNVLTLLNYKTGITLSVNSSPINHEFYNYDTTANVDVMYFALDLNSIGDNESESPLVNSISGTYRLLSNEDAVLHSRNYSLNVIKANIDHRDPFIHYARDSQELSFQQYDVTFRSFSRQRTIVDNSILTRNIPFAIILTPGNGAAHNPMMGESRISNYPKAPPVDSGSFIPTETVKRDITLTPHIDHTSFDPKNPPLELKQIYQDLGTYYHGLYEKFNSQDPQGIIYNYNPTNSYFSKSYYTDGEYTNLQPDSSLRTGSIQYQIVSLVENLKSWYQVTDLTWWDIFTRLTTEQAGYLYNINSNSLFTKLANGWRNIPVRDILSEPQPRYTGIESSLNPSDRVIITEQDRLNAQNRTYEGPD